MQEEEAKRAIERENGATVLKENQMAFQWPMVMLQATPAVGISIYVLGFLATNTYLSKFGIHEFDLISSRYVIVGLLYFLFVSFWYYFPGRFLLRMELYDSYSEDERSFRAKCEKWIEFLFLTCASSALFPLIFLQSAEAIFVCVLAMILWIVEPRWEDLWESKALYR